MAISPIDQSRIVVPSDGRGTPSGTNATSGGKGPGATATATPDTGPSPSIHEAMIARHLPKDPRTGEPMADATLDRMADAMRAARLGAERAERVAAALHANEMQMPAARHKQVRAEAWKSVEPALRQLDSARQAATQAIEALEAVTSAPPAPKDMLGGLKANEIRSVLRGLPEAEREAMLSAALGDDDDAMIGAVIDQPPAMSGISKARHQMLKASWQRKRHGDKLDRVATLKKALADLERGGELTIKFASGLSDEAIIKRAEASEARVRAALQEN